MDMNEIIDKLLSEYDLKKSEDSPNNKFRLCDHTFIANLIEKDILISLEKRWTEREKKISIIEFIKMFTALIRHTSKELLFLVIGLIDLFKEMLASTSTQ